MATVDITKNHTLSLEEAQQRGENFSKNLEKQLNVGKIEWNWEGDGRSKIQFKAVSGMAKGVTGTLTIAPATIRIEVELPGMLKIMAKGLVEQKINENLTELLK